MENFEKVKKLKKSSQLQQEKIVSRIENGESFPQYRSHLTDKFGYRGLPLKAPNIRKKTLDTE